MSIMDKIELGFFVVMTTLAATMAIGTIAQCNTFEGWMIPMALLPIILSFSTYTIYKSYKK